MKLIFRRASSNNERFKGHRFWRFYSIRRGQHQGAQALFLDLSLRRLSITLGLLLVLGYVLGALALSIFWGNRPHSPIGFVDVLLPTRWSQIRPMQGQMLIAQADEALEDGDGRRAFFLYRTGLRMYPQDQQARLILAHFLIAAQMYEQAADILAEGLDYGMPEEQSYIPTLIRLIQLRSNHPLNLEVVPKLIEFDILSTKPKARYALLRQLMVSQLQTGDNFGLLKTAEQINEDADIPYKAYNMAITALIQMGSIDTALQYIKDLPPKARISPPIRILKAVAFSKIDEQALMMTELQKLFQENPNFWKAQINAIMLMLRTEKQAQADAYITLFLNNHYRNPKAIMNLGSRLTDFPDSKRIQRLQDFAQKRRKKMIPAIQFFYIQALISENKFEQAMEAFEDWKSELPDEHPDKHYEILFGSILRALTQRGQDTQLALINELQTRQWEAEIFWKTAQGLYLNGQKETAIQVLDLAIDNYPFHPTIIDLRDSVISEKDLSQGSP